MDALINVLKENLEYYIDQEKFKTSERRK